MYGYRITGNIPLHGTIPISGSKNAALPIMAATLLTDETCIIECIPDIRDIRTMIDLLQCLGKRITYENGILKVEHNPDPYTNRTKAPYEIVKTMRASICVLGPLLTRYGDIQVALPGGCSLGPRPVDLHIKGMEQLGASIIVDEGYLHCQTDGLKGNTFELKGAFGPTVLGTDNVVMAAVLAQGKTVLHAAAREPEVEDLCRFLIQMGADIQGVGTDTLTITGVQHLKGTQYRVIPDRIETGTYIAMIAATKGSATLKNVNMSLLEKPLEIVRRMGIHVELESEGVLSVAYRNRFASHDIHTEPYPGFPTDLQPMYTLLNALANGTSQITEGIYPDRFIYISELNRMGAHIIMNEQGISINGVNKLSGAQMIASDIRSGAALTIAALAANGESQISRIYHIERGYEDITGKIKALGGTIERITVEKDQW
jgi:UDP-N-acetylglucosamine 1-carboxyvinyltransferase